MYEFLFKLNVCLHARIQTFHMDVAFFLAPRQKTEWIADVYDYETVHAAYNEA